MPTFPSLPRRGRLLDWLAIALLAFVFALLTAYQYFRLDYEQRNDEKIRELADRSLTPDAPRKPRFDWPQWRGFNRDGISTETDLLAKWPKDGPKLLWENPIGEGFSSVAIVKGRLFTIFQDHDNETVVCWDAQDGGEIWRHGYACHYKNSFGNGPRSTPTVDGDEVYTVGATGIMHCFKAYSDDLKGEVVWKKDLLREFDAPKTQWGVSFSPLIDGNYVYVQPGGPHGNSLAALDKRTGAIVWKKHDDPAGYSSPMAATFQGVRQILFFTGARLLAVDPDNGRQLWDHAWPTDYQCNIATPIIVQDYVFISSGYGRGCALLKIEKKDETWRPALVYKNRRMRNHFSSCVLARDFLYGFDDSTLTCMNFRTGKVQWQERGFGKGSLLLADDRLLIYGENGIAALAEASSEAYREISRFEFSTQHPCWAVPTVANGRLYLRDKTRLACFDLKSTSR